MQRAASQLHTLIEPVVTQLGYEFVGVEFTGSNRGLLRVYIDQEAGITVDDCSKVSYQVSGLLDVEDPISGQYSLEVSSPGLDRPLFKSEDYDRFSGQQASIRLYAPVEGQRKFKGVIRGIRDNQVVLMTEENAELQFSLDQIEKARLVPDY